MSYRVADVKNRAEVALEAGNSLDMIFQHYRELLRVETAKEWFCVMSQLLAAEKESLLEGDIITGG